MLSVRRPLPVPIKYLAYYFVYAQSAAIEFQGIDCLLQWGCASRAVALIAFPQFLQKGPNVSIDSFFFQLLIPALGAYFGARREEHLEPRVGEHHRPHVPALGHQARRLAKRPLAREQRLAHPRQDGHFRGTHTADFTSNIICNITIIKKNISIAKAYIQGGSQGGELGLALEFDASLGRRQRDQAIQGAAVEVVKTERLGDALGDRALARSRGAIDRDDWYRCCRICGHTVQPEICARAWK